MRTFALPRPWTVDRADRGSARRRLTDAERLTAAWIALVVVLVAARVWVLHLAEKALNDGTLLTPWLPLAIYQDIGFVAALAWLADSILRITSRPSARWAVRATVWATCLIAAWYAVASAEIFRFLSTPLTYRLIAMSDNLRGIRSSMESALTLERLAAVASAPIAMLVIAVVLIGPASRLVEHIRSLACQTRWRAALAGYLAMALIVTRLAGIESTTLANPHTTLLASLWDRDDPFVSGAIRESDLDDFRPSRERSAAATSEWLGRAKDCNVVMVVMESVGSLPLGQYGSPHDTTPHLTRLAERGVTFDRIYASQPYTSNAIAGIFCSLYPWHGWRSLPRRSPNLEVTGLGNVIQSHGYRTALLHTGDMRYDNEKQFLEQHGFEEVHDVWTLKSLLPERGAEADTPGETPGMHLHLPDELLLPAALRWIDSNRTQPFFLTLWTIQTHHPYFAEPSRESFTPHDPEQDRYLNAIRVTDRLLGDLMCELDARGLADSTLLVVMGDHGEAFGEHGHRGHSKTIHEEELRIPLVLISPLISKRPQRLPVLGQQIDIAPTIVELLGMQAPTEWQGRSLFADERSSRVYMFTAFHHYLFGVIDGDWKYVYNATSGRRQLFNLASDPGERRDVLCDSAERQPADLHSRLASWVHFQNQYLSRFLPESRNGEFRPNAGPRQRN
jgi:arylsulfatase A-like enzyme